MNAWQADGTDCDLFMMAFTVLMFRYLVAHLDSENRDRRLGSWKLINLVPTIAIQSEAGGWRTLGAAAPARCRGRRRSGRRPHPAPWAPGPHRGDGNRDGGPRMGFRAPPPPPPLSISLNGRGREGGPWSGKKGGCLAAKLAACQTVTHHKLKGVLEHLEYHGG